MKEAIRYRVTGGLFLLALAVIFLPMLFDGAGLPTVELEPLDADPVEVGDLPPPADLDQELQQQVAALAEEIDDDGFHAPSGTRLGEPVLSEPAGADAERSDAQRRAPPEKTGGAEPILQEVGPATQAWAVQVASFADVENARVFRGRLRDDGYEAFLSTLRTGGNVRTRVAVGPLQNRAEAVALQQELSSRYRVKARLMAFST